MLYNNANFFLSLNYSYTKITSTHTKASYTDEAI